MVAHLSFYKSKICKTLTQKIFWRNLFLKGYFWGSLFLKKAKIRKRLKNTPFFLGQGFAAFFRKRLSKNRLEIVDFETNRILGQGFACTDASASCSEKSVYCCAHCTPPSASLPLPSSSSLSCIVSDGSNNIHGLSLFNLPSKRR